MNILYFLQIQKRGNKYKMVMLPNFLNGKWQIYTGDECINHTAHPPCIRMAHQLRMVLHF